MKPYWFELETTVIPYVRMTQRGKFVNPRAQEYLTNQEVIKAELHNAMVEHGWEMLPPQTPLWMSAIFFVNKSNHHTQDLDNLLKAVVDAMQHIVFPNDCWVDHFINIQRIVLPPYRTCFEIGILGEEYDEQD